MPSTRSGKARGDGRVAIVVMPTPPHPDWSERALGREHVAESLGEQRPYASRRSYDERDAIR
jgi:hypothetical protein